MPYPEGVLICFVLFCFFFPLFKVCCVCNQYVEKDQHQSTLRKGEMGLKDDQIVPQTTERERTEQNRKLIPKISLPECKGG